MKRMAAVCLVMGLIAQAAACAATAQRSAPGGVNAEPEAPQDEEGLKHKSVETMVAPVNCADLVRDTCAAPCFWNQGAEKCTQEQSIVVHEGG
jgi:hypothetical protein